MQKQTKIICMLSLAILFLCKCGYGSYSINPMVSSQEKLECNSLDMNADGNLEKTNVQKQPDIGDNLDNKEYLKEQEEIEKQEHNNVQQEMQKEKTQDSDSNVIEQKSDETKYTNANVNILIAPLQQPNNINQICCCGLNNAFKRIFHFFSPENVVQQNGWIKIGCGEYKGGIKNGKREGYGECYIPIIQNFYKGYWKDDKRNGFGIEYMQNGKYEGMWKDNVQDGPGIVFSSHGDKKIGIWKNRRVVGYEAQYQANGGKMFGFLEQNEKNDKFMMSYYGDKSYSRGKNQLQSKKYIGEHQSLKCNGYGVAFLSALNDHILLKEQGEFKDHDPDINGGYGKFFFEDPIILCKHFILLDNNIANNADGVMKELVGIKKLLLPTYAYVDNTLWYYNGQDLPRECIVNIQNSGKDFIQQLQYISNEQLDLQIKLKAIIKASKQRVKNKFDLIRMYDGGENKNVQGVFQIQKNEQVIIPEDAREFITSYDGFIKQPAIHVVDYNHKEGGFLLKNIPEQTRILIKQMLDSDGK